MVLGNEPKFDLTSVIAVLPAVAELQELKLGMQILCLAIKCGFYSHLSLLTGLISLFSKWFTCNGETEDSVKLFKELLGSGERVSSSTIVGLIPVYSPFGHSYLCNCIHGFCVKYGVVSHSSVSTALTTVPHVFTSGDQSHPQSKAIYAELDKLTGKMTEAGFQTETTTVLHDLEEEEKELTMKVHSEKLAIAFGLISTEPGAEIRIIKNLRVCLDCHNWTKFLSKITERVIVVRDANRFHHFKDGVCSCGDYW
ncbi:hypothetical protein OIU84_010473 [Salix udensis]|uniref:DYW domain-containing protein n=1 Tax=Salix udensis TaxID=889485 RepID=A0AAD6JMW0_9ROSI|nr:hypothetical protein OIU84_010473 [Salix udensis]